MNIIRFIAVAGLFTFYNYMKLLQTMEIMQKHASNHSKIQSLADIQKFLVAYFSSTYSF